MVERRRIVRPVSIADAMRDQALLGAALGDIASWSTWVAVLKATFALPLTQDERTTFTSVAGNRSPPTKCVRELWALVGRRGGKSRMAAALAVFAACFTTHRLSPGETGVVLVLAASVDQARTVFNYIRAFLEQSPVLRGEVEDIVKSEIRLKSGIVIAIHPNSFRTTRGKTLLAAIFDEVAFWRDESTSTPDTETYSAILPSLLTTNGMLIGISTPYRKTGLLHAKHKRHYGANDDGVLVVQGSSRQFNPSLDDAAITTQREADPTASRSEWDAEFRDDISTFLDDALLDAAVDRARPLEIPWRPGFAYKCFTDPSGLAAMGDSYSVAIGHLEQGRCIVDCVRGRQGPGDPGSVTADFAALCRDYKIDTVVGDAYSAEWVRSAWRKAGMHYLQSDMPASQLYLEALPLFARGLVSLPNHPVLLRELRLLERSPSRSGRDVVTHTRNAHDDLANSVCGVLRSLAASSGYNLDVLADADPEPPPVQWKHPPTMTAELFARITRPPPLVPY